MRTVCQVQPRNAPPNLTDLSQTVLGLYDTLRHLEGEMLNQYIEERENTVKEEVTDDDSSSRDMALIPAGADAEIILSNTSNDDEFSNEKSDSAWSLSFTHLGLSLQAAVHNVLELETFLKDISGGIFRGFDVSSNEDTEHDSYSDEELDDSEYLVTIPICTFSELIKDVVHEPEMQSTNSDDDVTSNLSYLNLLVDNKAWKHNLSRIYPPHIVLLAESLEQFLSSADPNDMHDLSTLNNSTLSFVNLCMSALLCSTKDEVGDWTRISEQLAANATNMLLENTFHDIDPSEWLPIIQSILLLGWYAFVRRRWLTRARQLIVFAIRIFLIYQSQRNRPSREWQIAVMSLVYLDVLSSSCLNRLTLLDGDNISDISRHVLIKTSPPNTMDYVAESLLIEFSSIRLLRQVIRTFYTVDEDDLKPDAVNKVDVDDVLNLVKDVEKWETDLPAWASFKAEEDAKDSAAIDDPDQRIKSACRLHAHALHEITKVLLFRPFCTDFQRYENQNDNIEQDQTLTGTTFLDLSLQSALRIAKCHKTLHSNDFVLAVAKVLVGDVIVRVRKTFESDEDVLSTIQIIENTIYSS
ncbi:hypothetical protein NQZ79_g5443 [Umbelopsis isabellina]|nr:hypothetical protein NQZ79_g5443 [Umbelopsis isabellina]